MSNCCNGFTRSQALRASVARAGAGLPQIEPGMPLPAGTGLTRRNMLVSSAGVMMAVYGANKLGLDAFEEGIAAAATDPSQRVLVSVFLPGGIDSLSVLAPVEDPLYRQWRPSLALDPSLPRFSEDARLAWSPAASGLAQLHAEGKVSVIPAIGYTSPDQSHFTSRHYWEVGELSASSRLGWMGRYLDLTGSADNPLQGLTLGSSLYPSLAASSVPVAAVSSPQSYAFTSPGVGNPVTPAMVSALGKMGSISAGDSGLRGARNALRHTDLLQQSLTPFQKAFTAPVAYPAGNTTSFPGRLSSLAAMLAAGLPIRCVAINAPGVYDTHSNQATELEKGFKLTCDSLLAFQRDLEARGLQDRVLIQVWSEFGRRPLENGSQGTDHGTGGCSFIIGSQAQGQMVGEFTGLEQLDSSRNLRSSVDFRAVYSSLLEQWMNTEAGLVIPNAGKFSRHKLVKA